MKKLIDFCIHRPVAVVMLFLLIVIFGFISFFNLKTDMYPKITFPMIATITTYNGVGPEEIENIISKPLESAISAVPNIKKVTSQSMPESSYVIAEVNYGADMNFTALTIRERIDLVKAHFPEGVESPLVFKYDPAMMPILLFSVTSGRDLASTTKFIKDKIVPRLQRIPGVGTVSYHGGLEREIRVEVKRDKLAAYGLPLTSIEQTLAMENTNLPGGVTDEGNFEYTLRTMGEFMTVPEIAALPVSLPMGGVVPLSEVADVKDTYQEQIQTARLDGRPSLNMYVQRESDANTVQVSNRVKKELALLKAEFGADSFNYNITSDQADYIEKSLSGVARDALLGALLAVFIIWIFLRNMRSTMIIGTAIPISLLVTFAILYFNDMTLNIVTMGGLALGIGRLVDDSIVTLENIYRYMQEGKDRVTAAKDATAEVAKAIIASTCTTMVVFVPIVFVQGMTAQIFKEMALTVAFSLFASLIVALTLVPMLSSKFLKLKAEDMVSSKENKDHFFTRIQTYYSRFLTYALSHRKKIVGLAAIAFFTAFVPFFLGLKAEFMPAAVVDEISVSIKLPSGTLVSETDKVVSSIEAYAHKMPEVWKVTAAVGNSGSVWGSNSRTPELGALRVKLKPQFKEKLLPIMEKLRNFVKNIPDADIQITESQDIMANMGSNGGSPIQVEITGPDLDRLKQYADQAVTIIQNVPGTREVRSSYGEGRPELQLHINRDKANLYGLTAGTIAATVRTAFQGYVPTKFRDGGDEYDIRVQLREQDRLKATDLSSLMLQSAKGTVVPLTEVAQVVKKMGPSEIDRKDKIRVVTVTGQLYKRDLNSVTNDIRAALKKNLIMPGQYDVNFGGNAQDMAESFSSLALAFLLAIVFVYMVMAIQYESLLHPFTIMLTLPLTVFGVTWSLWLTGRALNVPAFIGIIMLIGIVVSNSIVLVDYINTLRSRGMSRREAILQAGPTRLRPVLMTALTTILAMFPLAIGVGEGGVMDAPLATVVIGGLSFATLLTLIAIPVLYTVMDDLAGWFRRLFGRQPAEYSVAHPAETSGSADMSIVDL